MDLGKKSPLFQTKLTMNNLLDISIGVAEGGVVNFNAMHQLLGAIIHKLKLGDCEVQCEPVDDLTMLLNLKRRLYEWNVLSFLFYLRKFLNYKLNIS